MSIKAHNLKEKERTSDVLLEEQLNFNALLLSERTLEGLKNSGFCKPSPIQLKAIPIGKCGFDLIVKSKSGTGKTAVFTVIALELVNVSKPAVQVLIVAPTREIAVQIQDVIRTIGSSYEGLCVESFIGGLSLNDDVKKLSKCHIAVGAPGRLKHLMQLGALNTAAVKLFVMDEADKLMDESFAADINEIFKKLPGVRQTIALSATYPDELALYLERFMSTPTHVTADMNTPLLLGLKQFVAVVKCNLNVIHQMNIKTEELIRILSKISFTQCLVFSNYQTRAESVSNTLNRKGWNSTYISGAQNQMQRLEAINSLKDCKCRILLSTDVTARGIDASNVDLVINYDVPYDASTYLHRMGRAGRYGSHGVCITLAASGNEVTALQCILGTIGGTGLSIPQLPIDDTIPNDLWNSDSSTFQLINGIFDDKRAHDKLKSDIGNVIHELKSRRVSKSKPTKANKEQVEGTSNVKATKANKETNEEASNVEVHSTPSMLATTENHNLNEVKDEVKSDSKKRKRKDDKSQKPSAKPTQNTDFIVARNVAFLNMTRLLVEEYDKNKIEDDVVDSIERYVTALKEQDETITEKGVQDFGSQTLNDAVRFLATREEDTKERRLDVEPDAIENIFKVAFDFATKSDTPHWLDVLGEKFEESMNIGDDKNMEQSHTEIENSSDDAQVVYAKNRYGRGNRKKYPKRFRQNRNHERHNACEEVNSIGNNETTIDYTNQSCVDYEKYPGLCLDSEYSNNSHFASCFEYYSKELSEHSSMFEDTASFESWFSQWQWHVQGIRDYVQQNIYLQEMQKYAYMKT